jgi:hypothetical protein
LKSHKQCLLSQFTQQLYFVFQKKTLALAGFEPGLSVPQAGAMTTALKFLHGLG